MAKRGYKLTSSPKLTRLVHFHVSQGPQKWQNYPKYWPTWNCLGTSSISARQEGFNSVIPCHYLWARLNPAWPKKIRPRLCVIQKEKWKCVKWNKKHLAFSSHLICTLISFLSRKTSCQLVFFPVLCFCQSIFLWRLIMKSWLNVQHLNYSFDWYCKNVDKCTVFPRCSR